MTQVFWLGKKQSIHTPYIQSKKKKKKVKIWKKTHICLSINPCVSLSMASRQSLTLLSYEKTSAS